MITEKSIAPNSVQSSTHSTAHQRRARKANPEPNRGEHDASFKMSQITRCLPVPSARRNPISRVRCDTA